MPSPTGSVVALSSAASTVFSIGIVFLGYWGLHEQVPWRGVDRIVVGLALIGFASLATVPWFATRSVEPESGDAGIRVARRTFAVGVILIWLAVALSVLF
jgi:hypothetical protein